MKRQRITLDDSSIVTYIVRQLKVVKGKKALQKITYFVESAGVPLSYVFRWWLYGPYSKVLDIDISYLIAEDVFDYQISSDSSFAILKTKNIPLEEEIVQDEEIKTTINETMKKLKKITDDFNPLKLELAASIHFIVSNASNEEDKSIEAVVEKIKTAKGNKFTKKEIREMYRRLIDSGLMRG